ncbi:hypothetical protein AJ79_06940 [Helicocarpus griseus UAMH5409]|uniref:HNH nuclease domain-containing protein n=1 Tax=Helicocarpus griseus UAMH5409 TaxID=1447875 RepID=A0A2B7X876_9EURO|nr:hypothetical protein AJ79_06940 [Helicocarpus griseus UAMH5409]
MASKESKRKRSTSPKPSTRNSTRFAAARLEEADPKPGPSSTTRGSLPPSTELGDENCEVLCIRAADRVNKCIPADRKHDSKLTPTPLALLEWLPDGGKIFLSRDILATDNDDDLHNVFWNVVTGLLSPMTNTSGRIPVSGFADEERENDAEAVFTKFRKTCLERDDYKCVVTKRMDTEHWENLGEPSDMPFGDLKAAHIIPFMYSSWNYRPTSSINVSNAWKFFYRCFPDTRRVGMSAEDINDSSNGIMIRT